MSNAHARFVKLHQGADLYVLPNVWDAGGARLVQQQGARAVGTSSAAMAWSCGHADGGGLPDSALLQRVSEIVGVTSLPVTVDIEDGYGDAPDVVAARVLRLADAGVVGINIEDGAGSPAALVDKITAIRSALGGRSLFINARTDVYLRGLSEGDEAVGMSIDRLQAYARAGADGGFVPGLRALDEASESDVAARDGVVCCAVAGGRAPAERRACVVHARMDGDGCGDHGFSRRRDGDARGCTGVCGLEPAVQRKVRALGTGAAGGWGMGG